MMMRILAFAAAFALVAGCTTTSALETGMAKPSIEISNGQVMIWGKVVSPRELPEILEEHQVSHDTVIHIRINELDHLREAQMVCSLLTVHGYRRAVLVTKEHAEAWSKSSARLAEEHSASARQEYRPPARQVQERKPKVRYRSADED